VNKLDHLRDGEPVREHHGFGAAVAAGCAKILNMVETCVRLRDCSDERILENFAIAGQGYFNWLEGMTVFTSRNFYGLCGALCTSKSYVAKRARSTLCGY
jgi:hypothetical protein